MIKVSIQFKEGFDINSVVNDFKQNNEGLGEIKTTDNYLYVNARNYKEVLWIRERILDYFGSDMIMITF